MSGVGESLGGRVALFLAIHHPDRLASLTVCSASHRGASIQRVREWRELVARDGMTAWSAMMMARRFAEGAATDALLAWFHREQSKSSAEATLDLADMLIATDLTPELPGIRTPTLLLAPDSSPFVPLEIALDAHARIPRSELRVFTRRAARGRRLARGRVRTRGTGVHRTPPARVRGVAGPPAS